MSTPAQPLQSPAMTAELEAAVRSAVDPEAIRAAIIAEAQKQTTAAAVKSEADAAQKAANDKAAQDAAAAAATAAEHKEGFSRTETIAGQLFEFNAPTELELERMVANAYRVAYAVQPDGRIETVEVDQAAAQAAAEAAAAAEVARKTELELKFKRGEISAADYIEQSGAVKDYLEKQGLPVDALKAAVESTRTSTFTKSWEQATQEFLASAAGQDWPGGEQNKQMIGMQVAALNLVDAPDKVAALAQAWATMKQNKTFFNEAPSEEDAAAKAAAAKALADKTAADAAAAAAAQTAARGSGSAASAAAPVRAASQSSSLFGASSGAGDSGAGAAERAVAQTFQVPKDASPAEIIEAWKQHQLAAGVDPNAAFMKTFSSKPA